MIDCLSNPDWINPQIDCLLFLQNIRIGLSDIYDKFFLSITIFGEFWLPTLICAITYWCIDFKAGVYLFTLDGFNVLLAHFFKMLACVYRPWVLSDKIQPSALAVPYAKGYSFPSGHSAMSSSVLGGVAYLVRKKLLICLLLIGLILLIGFSRMWLGVHTPQDVVCGLLIGLVLIFAVNRIINWAEKDQNRYYILLCIVNVLAILALVYVFFFNSYRIDYLPCGDLLVDPHKLKYVTAIAYGYSLGVINGCFLCRIFSPYNPKEVTIKTRVIRGLVGTIALMIMLKFVLEYIIMNYIGVKPAMLILFIVGIFITLVYPLIFIKIEAIYDTKLKNKKA